jgi:hypothetical protein
VYACGRVRSLFLCPNLSSKWYNLDDKDGMYMNVTLGLLDASFLALRMPYDASTVEALRRLTGAHWDAELRLWKIPNHPPTVGPLLLLLRGNYIRISSVLREEWGRHPATAEFLSWLSGSWPLAHDGMGEDAGPAGYQKGSFFGSCGPKVTA